jgi:hypothetical protein
MQWLMAKPVRTAKDDLLLRILLEAKLDAVNLPAREVDLSTWKQRTMMSGTSVIGLARA